MLRHRALQVAANAVLEQRIGVDRARHAVAILHVAPAPRRDAPRLGLAAGILVPVELDLGALGGFLRGQRLAAADHRRADLAARHHLEQAVDAPLRHVPAGMGVDQPLGACVADTVGDRFGRVLRPPERALEAPAGIGEGAQHDDRIQRPQQRLAAVRILRGLARGGSRQVHGTERNARIALALRDLPAANEYRHLPVIHGGSRRLLDPSERRAELNARSRREAASTPGRIRHRFKTAN